MNFRGDKHSKHSSMQNKMTFVITRESKLACTERVKGNVQGECEFTSSISNSSILQLVQGLTMSQALKNEWPLVLPSGMSHSSWGRVLNQVACITKAKYQVLQDPLKEWSSMGSGSQVCEYGGRRILAGFLKEEILNWNLKKQWKLGWWISNTAGRWNHLGSFKKTLHN